MKTKMKFSKQILSVLLCLAMLISYVPVFSLTASAATVDVWNGTTASQAWDSGSGTEADPYIIMTAAQLAKLAADVNSGTDYSGTYFKLGADLDLGGSDRIWTPIGDATHTFKGNFNGDGKTISNMYAHGKNTNNKTYGYRALFGNITGGTIENFTLASPSSTGAWGYIAAAVAYGSGATVKNIIITNPNITTQAKSNKGSAGGVAGHIADGVIENCKIVSGTIDSKFKCTGGVVGYATDAQISGCAVKDVAISSTFQYVGGIVGQLQYTDGINSIENCTVENCAISSTSSAVGGVLGYSYGNSSSMNTVKNCGITGGSVNASYIGGGIVGNAFQTNVIGCYNYGATITVTASGSSAQAGGITGYNGKIYSCFSSADVLAPNSTSGRNRPFGYDATTYCCAYDKTVYTGTYTYQEKAFTTEEVRAGAATYYLANPTSSNTNYYTNWGQKIGTDLYPVWNTDNDSSIVVYREDGSNGYRYFNEGTVDVFEPNEDGYYEISDTETWYKFARKAEEDASVKGLVTAAIDFSAISADAIEDYRICADVAFTGTFDGGNKTVSGLPETDKPLFGTIGVGGKLLNMTLSGATVTSRYDTAGLVLENNGKVENCTVSNVTVSGSIVSGMIGENNGTISNCTAENVTVSSTSSSAGLVSYNTGTIEDCAVVSGTITADSTSKGNTYDAWAGGICGISIGGKISGCSNGANVIAESGDNHAAAGIVAAPSKDSSENSVQVTECFNTGAISSDYYAGGITGFYETSVYVSISLCYNTGNIEGTTVGGIAASGSNNRNDNFINCYNAGQVNGSKAGGIAGSRGNVIIQNCHNYAKVVSTNIGAPIVGMDLGAWPGTGNLINNHAIEGNVEAPTVRSFYDTATATSSSNAVIKGSTKEQFESGEIAYLLQQANGGAAVWSQGESYPVFASDENDKVVKIDFYAVIDEIVHENSYATIYLIPGRVLTEADYPSPSDIDCTLEGCYLDRDCTMAIDRTAFTADTDTKLFVKLITHRHDWTYTKENETTITATCIADGCTAKDGGSVKLVAPTELTYNGTAKEATLQFDNWQLGDDAKPTISYNDTDKVAVTNKDIVATITLGVESASVTYKVKPASISGATVTADTVNYTGNAQTPDVSVVLNGKTLVKDTDYTVSYNNNTNAGTATVTVTGTGNYEGTATGTFTITDTAEPTGAILIKDNTWLQFLNNITFGLFFKENVDVIVTADGTGSAVDKVEYLFSSTELNKNNLPADGWKTVEGNNGTYTFAITARNKGAVYVKITDAYGNVAVINSDGIVVYTDSKVAEDTVYFTYQSTEDAVIDLELNGNTVKNVLFNGHEITNYWSVGGNKLTLDADYLGRLVVLDNGAGYPVTVYFNPLGVETEKVELKDEFTLVIQKADGSVTNISNIGKTYDGTSVSEPTFDKLGDGVATIEYKVKGAEDCTYTTIAPKNAGDYVVRVTVAEGTNYKEASATAEFTIDKVAITVTADAKSKTYGEGDPALAWNITSGALVNGEQLTGINISRVSGENANTYAITVSQVDGANKNYDITFVDGIFTINAKTLNATVVVNGAPFTYNGSKHEPEIAVKDGNTVIPANEYEVGYANNINAGTATVTITDKDGGNYVVNGTATFIINKADPVIGTVGVDGVVKDSTKPSDVVLTRTNATVNGVLTLADNAMLANKSTYRWVFTPTDTDNYNVINGDVQIDVLDTVLPTAEIKVDTNEWKHFINNITFGLFFKETQEVTIVAADNENGSGIKEILYFVSDNELEEEDLATVEWKSYAEAFNIEPDGKYVIYAKVADKDGNTVVINSDGVVVDETAAVVSGITDGETYYGQLVFTVTDELAGVKSVVIDGVDKTHFEGQYLINGDNAEHTVIVTDNAGNVTEYKVTVYKNYTVTYKADGESISTETVGHGKDANLPSVPAKDGYVGKWDGDGKNITGDTTITVVYTEIPVVKPDEVKPEDKSDLEDAKEKLEEMLEDDSYTDDDKKDIQDAIDDIDDALDIIGNVEAVEELIDKLPDTIKKDDEAAIKAADDAYNALTDYEKSLVDEDAKKALDDAKAALAELKKPADTDSPQTGDNSNMALWIALLFISGGAVITLTVVDRKRRMASKR